MRDGAYDEVEAEANALMRMTTEQFLLMEVPIFRPLLRELKTRAMG